MTDPDDAKTTAICRLPVDFHERGNVSLRELLSRTGYRHGDSLAAKELIPVLREHPDWIDAWFVLSEDKRTTGGWFLREVDNQFVVGSTSSTQDATRYFNEKGLAVAEFIVREIDEISTALPTGIRDSLVRKPRPRSG